jgi:carbonic anhydrase
MKKLIKGIVEFRQNIRPGYREMFAKLALQQSPDTLFIACSDSRVAVNVFASTDPGDLFVVRNVGNLVPCCECGGQHVTEDLSAAAAIEFAVVRLKVSDIIVCGHSDCGAMHALLNGREKISAMPHLQAWLRHGEPSLARLAQAPASGLSPVNVLSQLNILQQIEHLKSYPVVRERMAEKRLRLNGWWFDLGNADVYAHTTDTGQFTLINTKEAERLLEQMG